MVSAAVIEGLAEPMARNLGFLSCVVAGFLAQQDDTALSELRRRVTSPGGTTEKAIASLQDAKFEQIVQVAMDACLQRAKELAEQV